jgi:hypothetical protein
MPNTVTRTSPTFSQIEAPVVLASGVMGTLRSLDLKTKFGAWVYVRIGRRAATALTRAAYVAIRRTSDNSLVLPIQQFDAVSQSGAAISNTLASAAAINDETITLTSAASFAVGDTICMHSDDSAANRVEFARIVAISGNVLTLERGVRIAHNSGDRVTTMADAFPVYIPGGDIYGIRCINNSGQALVFAVDAAIDESETIT